MQITFQALEEAFNRAWLHAFSKVKFFFVFPVLLICGVLIVFCRAISMEAGSWVAMSLTFLPVFLSLGILLAAGVILIRIYYHEVKQLQYSFRKLLGQSVQMLVGASYLSLPLVLTYLLLWTLMGVFHLFKGIPGVGEVLGVLLSFGPFLLVFASLALSLTSLLILFYVTPHIALRSQVHLHIAEEIFTRLRTNVFSNLLTLFIGIAPLLFTVGFLTFSAVMTGIHYLSATSPVGVSLEWFFIMVPFVLILTPFVIFFFNFSTESFNMLQRKKKITFEKKSEENEESCVLQ